MKIEDAIKRYESWAEDDRIDVLIRKEHRQIADWLKELKSKQTDCKGEWIPCSERLPNYREVVLISTFWGVRMAERDSVKEDGTDDFWYLFLNDATAHPRYVYAWMPLPEPWKGADDETDND